MAEALARVHAELGADSVVLHTRRFKRGGLLGLGARAVVEVTAVNADELRRHRQKTQGQSPRAALLQKAQTQRRSIAPPTIPPIREDGPLAGDLIRRTYAAARAEMSARPTDAGSTPVAIVQTPTDSAAIAEEMRQVRRMVGRMLHEHRSQGERGRANLPGQLFDAYLNLVKHEVAEELAQDVVSRVCEELGPDELDDAAKVRRAVLGRLASLIPTQADKLIAEGRPPGDRRPYTIALIGPTGVGKTTTVAKLAATYKLKHAKRVGLITIDTYRIAAVDQLKTYAGIIGVPLVVVMSPAEMTDALRELAGCDVVLIDTAGRSQRDDPRLEQLRAFIEAASPHEVHLVLSSTCTEAVMLEAAERFGRVRTDSIIFTKLDEAVSFGVLLNVVRSVNKKLSYLTTGQEVPHQIEPGRPERLAALVAGEGRL